MSEISMDELARQVKEKRASKGIRETAKIIDVSPATLSRVEKGNVPDLDTFRKICLWLEVDPGAMLGCAPEPSGKPAVRVHFKKDRELSVTTATALAEMILAAHRAMEQEEGL